MAFNIEDQYQQFLYPDAIDYVNNERNGRVEIYQDYNKVDNHSRGSKPSLPPNAIKILILNDPNKLNKRLIKFFMSNLEYMNSKNIFFDWIVVYDDEIDNYEEQDITEFPVLISEREKISGVNAIINRLQNIIASTKNTRGRSNIDGSEGELRNYFLRELDDKRDDDMDEDSVFAQTVTQRIAAMNKSRQAAGQHAIRTSNPEIHERTARAASRNNNYGFNEGTTYDPQRYTRHSENNNATRKDNLEYVPPEETPRQEAPTAAEIARVTNTGSIDDELMMGYWENQQETDMY